MTMLLDSRLVLSHFPRTGGTWARTALVDAGVDVFILGSHRSTHQIARMEDERGVRWARAVFSRDPAAWYQSWWRYRQRLMATGNGKLPPHEVDWSAPFSSVITALDRDVGEPFDVWAPLAARGSPLTAMDELLAGDVGRSDTFRYSAEQGELWGVTVFVNEVERMLRQHAIAYDRAALVASPPLNMAGAPAPALGRDVHARIVDAEREYITRRLS